MRLLSQMKSHRQGVVVILDLEVQEEESQVSQETDEALIVSLETVFLNQEEAAQDQATVAEDQMLVAQENQATAANQRLVRLEDQAAGNQNLLVIQQINRLTRIKDQSQKLVGKRTKPFLSSTVIKR